MEFRILGSTEVLDGTRRLDMPMGRGRALLALLVLHAGEPVSAERLIDELWNEHPPPTANTVVQGFVSKLRAVLEPGRKKGERGSVLETVAGGYRLAIDPDAVDAYRFKRLIDEGRGEACEARAAKLATALDLWRGPALADFVYEPFAQRAIAALEELKIEALEERLEAELTLGRGRELVSDIEHLTLEHPYREKLRGFLMLALYRAERQSDALEVFRAARAALIEDIGVEPGPDLRELQAAILRQDPALGLPGSQSEPSAGDDVGSWLPRERKLVTVVAVDLSPSADGATDPEVLASAGARAADVAIGVLERHGGRVERVLGEMLIAFFGFPITHEDDALRAARAAVEVLTAAEALNDGSPQLGPIRYRARLAIDSGDIVVQGPGSRARDVAGTVVGSATRLQLAADDAVVVGRGAQRLLRGAVLLKAIDGMTTDAGGTSAWRLLEVLGRAPAVPRSLAAPMFGRQNELTKLRSAFRRVVRSRTAMRFGVLGEAGIGKSRLAKELVASIGSEAHAITLECPSHGNGSAFYPLRVALVEAAGLRGWRALHDLLASDNDEQVVPDEIAPAIGLRADPRNAEPLFLAMRRLFERLASDRPLVVVFEDLHWAEPTVLDLVEHLDREAEQPIFLSCLARPELLESRPGWDIDDVLHLEPLPMADAEDLVRDRAGSIDPDTLRRIIEVSQGNPLFAEQFLAALADGTREPVPASLLGLLNMRIDCLGPGERDLLRGASIVGMEFDQTAVSALLPNEARPFMPRHLETLQRRRLIESTETTSFRFRHLLIHLATYRSMASQDRAHLHGRLAKWLQSQPAEVFPELTDALDFHRERAAEQRRLSGTATGGTPYRDESAGVDRR